VKARIHRARAILKAALERKGLSTEEGGKG